MMERIKDKTIRLFLPACNDVFISCESFKRLETLGEVVCVQEAGQMFLKLSMRFVIIAFDGGFFKSSVHAFNLSIGPGMIGFGEAMFDAMLKAAQMEHMTHEACCSPFTIAGLDAELCAIISQNSMNFIGYDLDQIAQEIRGNSTIRGFV